ncbi:HERC1 [Symbiodinium natans]|uniref:HERC1 protein n=1 Tax=Symbiodinium natans TaxID=878477 RepID=A0A812JAD9_9DINO|nr:HERC1 [Symbiodinium natans]
MCVLMDNGLVKCYGQTTNGASGQPDTVQTAIGVSGSNIGDDASELGDFLPAIDLGSGPFPKNRPLVFCCPVGAQRQIAVGDRYACALLDNSLVKLGDNHACALLDDNTLKCWGSSYNGQSGQDSTSNIGQSANQMGDYLPPIDVGAGRRSRMMATSNAGVIITLAISAMVIGMIEEWAVGDTSGEMGDNLPFVNYGTGRTAQHISIGNGFQCALLDDSTVKCMGYGEWLGYGDTTQRGKDSALLGDHLPVLDFGTLPTTSMLGIYDNHLLYADHHQFDKHHFFREHIFQHNRDKDKLDKDLQHNLVQHHQQPHPQQNLDNFSDDLHNLDAQQHHKAQSSKAHSAIGSVSKPQDVFRAIRDVIEMEQHGRILLMLSKLPQRQAVAVELAESLNFNTSQGNATGGILAEVSAEVDTGQLKVVAFLPEALDSNVTTVTAFTTSQEEVSRVEVPREVLAQAATAAGETGAVLLSITTIKSKVAGKFQDRRVEGEATSVVGSHAVSINMRAPDGSELRVQNLDVPLRIVIKTDLENATCAFWDEREKRWSPRGVTTVPDTVPGQITCLTVHLSIFSAVAEVIWDNALLALVCSSAWDLLTPAGFQRLSETKWQSTLPAVSVFVFLALFALVFARAALVDRRNRDMVPWEEIEPALFRQAPASEVEEVPKGWCMQRVAEAKDWTLWCAGICFGVQDIASLILECKAPEASVNRCIRSLHAHRSGVAKDSLAIILQPDEKFELEEEPVNRQMSRSVGRRSRFSRLVQEVGTNMDGFGKALRDLGARWNVHIHGANTVQCILDSRWYKRVGLLFPAFHPWIALLRLSLLTSYKVRVSLIFLKLCTAGATNALFFTSSSPGPDSDPSCKKPQTLVAQLVQNTVVGVVSALLGDVIIFTLFLVQNRSPMEKDWTERSKKWQMRVWKCRALAFWLIWLVYSLVCLVYTMLFLANVRLADAHGWYMSTGMSLLQDLVILPLFLALALGLMASAALLSKGIRRRIEARWLEGYADAEEQVGKEPEEAPPGRRNSNFSQLSEARLEGGFAWGHRTEQAPQQQAWANVLPGIPHDV